MKKTLILISIGLVFLLSACNENNEEIEQRHTEINKNEEKYVLNNSRFYYDTLNDKDKELYKDFSYFLYHQIDKGTTIYDDINQANKIFTYVLYDHPEYYYHKEGLFTLKGNKLTIEIDYLYNFEERKTYDKQIKEETNKILSLILENYTDFEKIKVIYDEIGKRVSYRMDVNDNQSLVSSLVHKQSVCNGYSKMFQYLLIQSNINVSFITGTLNGDSHAWNFIIDDSNKYYFDVTNGDKYYNDDSNTKFIDYAYFGMNSNHLNNYQYDIELKELFDSTTQLDYYYFTINHKVFSDYDSKRLKELMYEAFMNKSFEMELLLMNDTIVDKIEEGEFFDLYYELKKDYSNIPDIRHITYAYQESTGSLYIKFLP